MRQVPATLVPGIEKFLTQKLSEPVTIKDFSSAGGGCINACGKLQTSLGIFFLKWNDASRFPAMLSTEAQGLDLLRTPKAISVPQLIGVGEYEEYQFIIMEYIHQGRRSNRYWENFGEQLARLHQVSSEQFGLDHHNYIGSLQQFNSQASSWSDFFVYQRLAPQVDLAIKSAHFTSGILKRFDSLYKKLPDLLPEEKPALLHGDLWGGNLIVKGSSEPCLIDPAVYFGHREVDLAMTQLFGGFDDRYLNSYHEVYPITPGFADRIQLYNLYPLLVHVNLFGGGYIRQVNSILKHYVT